jgi:hypothetical protein
LKCDQDQDKLETAGQHLRKVDQSIKSPQQDNNMISQYGSEKERWNESNLDDPQNKCNSEQFLQHSRGAGVI